MRGIEHVPAEPTIAVVYLLYRTGPDYDREKPIRALKQILARLPGRKSIICVDNSASGIAYDRQQAPNEYDISGENRYLEFSGWQRGIDYLKGLGIRPDVWLLANDTFLKQSRVQRLALNQSALRCALVRDAVVGRRMMIAPGAEILGNKLIPYARTHLFLLSAGVMDRLGSVVSLNDRTIDKLLLRDFDPSLLLFQKDAPLSEVTRDIIISHLTNDWYRKKPYVREHFEQLRRKAISILNSFLLSLRVHQLGYPLISYTRAGDLLDSEITTAELAGEWLDGFNSTQTAGRAQPNPFWEKTKYLYRRVPEKKRAFTWSRLLDLIESRPGREHM